MNKQSIVSRIAQTAGVQSWQVTAALHLLDSGNTIPFIARYRKEMTGVLDEVQLRRIAEQHAYETALEARREAVRQSITEQGGWTPELAAQLETAQRLQDIEDLYLPYKPKKRTKASVAREAGLEPLAELLWRQDPQGIPPAEAALPYVSEQAAAPEDALQGAANILAERMAELASFRRELRRLLWKTGRLQCTLAVPEADAGPMATYASFDERISRIPSHRILAINRGEAQKILKVTLKEPAEQHIHLLYRMVCKHPSPYADLLYNAAADSYKRLIFPQMEREIRSELTEKAEKQAISVFSKNLRSLLLQRPFPGQVILGLDPGYRTGCKAAVISQTGRVLAYDTYYLTGSARQREESKTGLARMIQNYKVTLISIGNGTASYETEQFVSQLLEEIHADCRYVITNEAGASVYSASDLAREELPGLDVTIRGAVSIARRLQDPLAESVKIDPKSIGVGQYQHDVNQKSLSAALDDVVESVVNYVGADLNTASPSLLQHVAGLSAATAANIVAYRSENGPFTNRQELLLVNRLGPATFTQCAGFLRIRGGTEALDNTAVHPESYELACRIIQHYGFTPGELNDTDKLQQFQQRLQLNAVPSLAKKLHAGEPTILDIVEELRKPGRDVRDDYAQPLTRTHVTTLDELTLGTIVRGTIQNVVDFGAFLDFGLKTPGLIHRSELCSHAFSHPTDVVRVGDITDAIIISIDAPRGRIGLSIKRLPHT